jgi:HdeA/HdeB family
MRQSLLVAAAALSIGVSEVRAQTDLSAYADANGFLDVQKLTCAQLANTWQGDADLLTAWYSGWYNGLAKKHYMDIRKGKISEHEVILYCKANPEKLIIEAIAVVFNDERARLGIHMK